MGEPKRLRHFVSVGSSIPRVFALVQVEEMRMMVAFFFCPRHLPAGSESESLYAENKFERV